MLVCRFIRDWMTAGVNMKQIHPKGAQNKKKQEMTSYDISLRSVEIGVSGCWRLLLSVLGLLLAPLLCLALIVPTLWGALKMICIEAHMGVNTALRTLLSNQFLKNRPECWMYYVPAQNYNCSITSIRSLIELWSIALNATHLSYELLGLVSGEVVFHSLFHLCWCCSTVLGSNSQSIDFCLANCI